MTAAAPESTDEYVFPLSYQQQRLWFVAQFDPDSAAYHLPVAMRLRGRLDVGALDAAFEDVLGRHEALRTRFERDSPAQVVLPGPGTRLVVIDGGGLSPAVRDRWMSTAVGEIVRRPFELWSAAPVRAMLLRLGPDDHVLVLVVHHIAADGWSIGILLADLRAAYASGPADGPASRPDLSAELSLQYGDYALWQRELTQADPASSNVELQHWVETLAGTPAALALPTDYPRRPVEHGSGARVQRRLDPALVEALERLGGTHRVSMFMAVLAAYAWVLSRMSGQRDLVIGTPAAGRGRPEVASVVGCFIDLLPVRLDLTGHLTLASLLQRVRIACLTAFAHADVPFERLVERLHPVRDLTRSPIFQTMLSFDGARVPPLDLPGLAVEAVPIDSGAARYEVTIDVETADDGALILNLEYRSDLFAADSAARILGRLEQALRSMVAARPDAPVVDLEVLDAEELAWLQDIGQGPPAAGHGSALDLVRAAWRDRPDDVAVVDGDGGVGGGGAGGVGGGREWTFREVVAAAERLAVRLASSGVRRGDLVGVRLPRSGGLVPAVLGVWAAGAAYLPLDPTWPEARLRYLVADAGVRVVLTAPDSAGPGEPDDIALTSADADADADADAAPVGPRASAVPATASDVAYVLYTSGSTGRPKGVSVAHQSVVNFLESMRDHEPGLSPRDRVLAVTTLSFDISVLELVGSLAAGATVVVATAEQAADPYRLGQAIGRHRPTVLQATPTMWRMLLASGWRGTTSLRAFVGGEPLAADLARQLIEAGHEVWNLYGPTETTIWSTVGRITGPVHLGRPVAGTTVRLLDSRGALVPAGAQGEVHLGGVGVAHGYRRRPGLTAERFVPDPHRPGARTYRTGDIGRWRPDGTLAFVGRVDGQHKIRGHRIELGEIETVLNGHPAVAAAVVAVHRPTPHDPQLVGYLQWMPGSGNELVALTRYLREQLPASMVPTRWIELDGLPRTPNGKLDRAALPPPGGAAPAVASGGPDEPTDDLDRAVVESFRRTLGVPGLGMSADFFEHGGTSLTAVELVADIERSVGVRLELPELFRSATPAAAADLVRRAKDRFAGLVVAEPRDDIWSAPSVLVIGATGAVGASLVGRLLELGVVVHCAVPAKDRVTAEARLEATAQRYGLRLSGDRLRVLAVDPHGERFGLADTEYSALSREVGAVYHIAPPTAGGRADARSEATLIQAIELAADGYGKALHHVRPLEPGLAVDGVVAERISAEPDEAMVYRAASRGVPVTVTRVGPTLPGPAAAEHHGVADSTVDIAEQSTVEGPALLLAVARRTGLLPDLPDQPRHLLAADRAAQALAALTRRPMSDGRVFNLVDPGPTRFADLAGLLDRPDRRIRCVPVDTWREAVDAALPPAVARRLHDFVDGLRRARPLSVQTDAVTTVLGRPVTLLSAPLSLTEIRNAGGVS